MFKIFNNISFKINLSWLLFDKLFRASLNILLSILLARYLGPENFGVLNYLIAFIFLFNAVSSLGMNPVLTNLILKQKKKFNKNLLTSAYHLRIFASIICYIVLILIILIFNEKEIYLNYSLIAGLIIIFKSSEILFSYFEAKLLSKFIVISQLVGLIFLASIVFFVINKNLNDIYIYYGLFVDAIIVFFLINYFYISENKKILNKFHFKKIKNLILKSLPVLISSLSIILYMRIDQIMINSILSEYQLGIYSVSVRYIEIFHFIPKIIMISLLPILLASKKYVYDLVKINSIFFKCSIFLIGLIFLSSDFIIPFLFGNEYLESVLTTKILSFTLLFVFFGVINEHWYISKNLQKYYAIYVFLGAILNIIFNYILINKIGIQGAAYSTILTYFIIIFLFDYSNKKTRFLMQIKYRSLFKI